MSQRGMRLWRNNTGVAFDQTGRPVRFGLSNESAQVNAKFKSSDLIGITPVVIEGRTVGVFTSLEIKHPGWKYTGGGRETAQKNWLDLVNSLGGIGKFITSLEDL